MYHAGKDEFAQLEDDTSESTHQSDSLPHQGGKSTMDPSMTQQIAANFFSLSIPAAVGSSTQVFCTHAQTLISCVYVIIVQQQNQLLRTFCCFKACILPSNLDLCL